MAVIRVGLDLPSREHFEYRLPPGLNVSRGSLVLVPFGRSTVTGIVFELTETPTVDPTRLRDCVAVIGALPPLPEDWLVLIGFAARYYQRGEGEAALQALPQSLRAIAQYRQDDDGRWSNPRLDRLLAPREPRRGRARPRQELSSLASACNIGEFVDGPRLNADQQAAVDAIGAGLDTSGAPLLLHGITGSGKTEVYLSGARQALDRGRQALLLVPEINLTPQLLARVEAAFPGRRIVALHSGLAELERLRGWLAAASGAADIVLGTRLAIFTPMPRLGLIVVDEEHDASYKQQDGLRYSARDLAVWRAHQLGVPVVLGSATPSFESWANVENGRYRRLDLPGRARAGAALPEIRIVASGAVSGAPAARVAVPRLEGAMPDAAEAASVVAAGAGMTAPHLAPADVDTPPALHDAPAASGIKPAAFPVVGSPPAFRLLDEAMTGLGAEVQRALVECLAAGRQSLVFLNRRGYAPVLSCPSCGWGASCPRCSAHLVWHKSDRRLHCHLCGLEHRVPRACPTCGNQDVRPFGRGTQRVEEALAELLPTARIVRIDADSTRRKGSAEALFDQVHAGEADVLVGTQMVAKGHDFQNVALVVALGADAALYSHDFRAPERLFQQLMQVAGRAGRAGADPDAPAARVLVQTGVPAHPLYAALVAHDYSAFAHEQLAERQAAGLPPYSHHAVLRAEARNLADAVGFLADARDHARAMLGDDDSIGVFDPVPMSIVRVANIERAQLLVEAGSRARLQAFLPRWIAAFGGERLVGRQSRSGTPSVRWHLEVDPIDI
ncbi:replication restart helicase PriA [Derxia gummosa]|uniref:Replication restart protein PriA n=1 Tax=Derxia gummosa DSM 723 TaxID=1121388 RepID=A0A8B6X7Y8_9BURK|nr:primosomal protein N' [Derxia gummosa]